MTVKVNFASDSPFGGTDLIGVIDFITTESTISRFTTTFFGLTGTYDGFPAQASVNGSGFSTSTIGGDTFVVSGTVDLISFSSQGSTVTFQNVAIDLAVLTPIIIADLSGSNPFGIENFLLNKAWDITFGNGADVLNAATLIGDGLKFNPKLNDIVNGLGGNDNLFTGDGNDILMGGDGHDKLDGGRGADVVKGGTGRDTVRGGAGNDMLEGNGARDVLIGGKGNDRFIFANNSGRDKVKDFNALNNKEDIDLTAVTRIKSFKDLKNNHMSQVGDDVVIDDNANTKVVLIDTLLSDLGAKDFIF